MSNKRDVKLPPTFKFVFKVSASTGGLTEWKNNPGESVLSADLLALAREFFEEAIPLRVRLAEGARSK